MKDILTVKELPAFEKPELYPVLDEFFRSYLVERDIEKTLALVTEDVYSIGTGENEVAVGRKNLEGLLRMEIEAMPEPIGYQILEYREKPEGEDAGTCFCQVRTTPEKGLGELMFYQTRFSASFRRVEGRWLASAMHMSEASRSQEKEEFFPLRFLSRQAARFNERTQKLLLDIMCGMIPGGVIGRYLEEGFPLYVINDTMLEMMGYTYEEFVNAVNSRVANAIYEEDADRVAELIRSRMETDGEYVMEYRIKKKTGGYLWVQDVGRRIVTEDGREAVISVLVDISEDVQNRIRLMEESSRDFLTEVYNRRGGEIQIAERMKIPMPYAFFMIDLDNFKKVNDLYSHEEGDRMLHFTGRILKQIFRQTDVVIRVGGDEFAVLAYPCKDMQAIRRKADEVIRMYGEEAEKKYPLSGTSVSIGGIYGSRPRSFLELYKMADQVLYRVKKKKGYCEIWEADQKNGM